MKLETPIRDIMTTELTTVSPDTTIKHIEAIFKKESFHHLPVVTPGSQLVGIISRDDFRVFYHNLSTNSSGPTWVNKQLEHQSAKNIMTATPLSLDPDDTVGLAADIFLANQFHALPVEEDNTLIGILTTHDILAYGIKTAKIEPVDS